MFGTFSLAEFPVCVILDNIYIYIIFFFFFNTIQCIFHSAYYLSLLTPPSCFLILTIFYLAATLLLKCPDRNTLPILHWLEGYFYPNLHPNILSGGLLLYQFLPRYLVWMIIFMLIFIHIPCLEVTFIPISSHIPCLEGYFYTNLLPHTLSGGLLLYQSPPTYPVWRLTFLKASIIRVGGI